MPYIATYLNWKQYWKFRELREKLDLTDYGFLKKIVLEALNRSSRVAT